MSFIPSVQQKDFFDWVINGEGSCVLTAVAGSGKTTTIIEALKLMKGAIYFGAYNKKISEEISAKVPKSLTNVTVSTIHAAGFAIWRKTARNVKVDSNKLRDLFRSNFDRDYCSYEGSVTSLVSYAKQSGLGAIKSSTPNTGWVDLIEHFNVDTYDNETLVIDMARKLLKLSIDSDTKIIDFDDMIYAPLVHKCSAVVEYDYLLIDECQDLSPARLALSLLMLKRGGRLIAVGDERQAIYGFSGADSDSVQNIIKAVNAIEMPLTVTYRCPKAVVKEAQKYVSHITAHESAIEGSVTTLKGSLVNIAKPGDSILCRFNAPIIKMVYEFIAEGIPAKVEGREIGTALKTLAKRWKVKSFSALTEKLNTYKSKESAKFRAKEKESMAVAVEDKVKCIQTLIDRVIKIDPNTTDPIFRLCQEIDMIFEDNLSNKVVILSSIHKSKGREWSNIFYLQTGESKWARQSWEILQEQNLKYVAVTRAQKNLYLCEDFDLTNKETKKEIVEVEIEKKDLTKLSKKQIIRETNKMVYAKPILRKKTN